MNMTAFPYPEKLVYPGKLLCDSDGAGEYGEAH